LPGFVKTKKDEKKWSSAKQAAAKQTSVGSDSYWKLANYIFHKSEGNEQAAKMFKNDILQKAIGGLKNPSLSGTAAVTVKMPKAKKPADPFGKPSLLKSEENELKKSSIEKLSDFLNKKRDKK
jgi:hypothetical protein